MVARAKTAAEVDYGQRPAQQHGIQAQQLAPARHHTIMSFCVLTILAATKTADRKSASPHDPTNRAGPLMHWSLNRHPLAPTGNIGSYLENFNNNSVKLIINKYYSYIWQMYGVFWQFQALLRF